MALATVAPDPEHPRVPARLVVKELRDGYRREVGVYRALWRYVKHPPTARMHGVNHVDDRQYLYLEHVDSATRWPWSNTEQAAEVCRVLARLHQTATLPRESFGWRYEDQLDQSAEETLRTALWARDAEGRRYWQRIGELKRVVGALRRIRSQLLASGTSVIHGDVHPGNVIVRHSSGNDRVALIDWGRARMGSPLEDVASWLHSLGCWEPQARRRHDTLLRAYLDSCQYPPRLTAHLRRDYWLASTSNGLAGAVRHHLTVLADDRTSEAARYHSSRALPAWQRVIRQGAAQLSTNPDR